MDSNQNEINFKIFDKYKCVFAHFTSKIIFDIEQDGFGKVVKVNSNPKSSLDDNKNKPDITFMIDKQNDSSDNFAKRLFMGLLGTDDNTRITDDQKQCIAVSIKFRQFILIHSQNSVGFSFIKS